MRVSVITVCFNSAETIEDTIKSIRSQDYGNIEHIVVDGGSTDGTLEVIERYRHEVHGFVSEPDGGVFDAMNKGLHIATGDLVGFLNSDDIYNSKVVISDVVSVIKSNGFDAVYGDLVYTGRRDTSKIVRYWQPGEYTQGAFLRGWAPPHPTFFCRLSVFKKFGCFNRDYKVAADFELMLRFIEKYHVSCGYIPRTLVRMRAGGKANTVTGIIRGNREVLGAFRNNGFDVSVKYLWQRLLLRVSQLTSRPKSQGDRLS